MIRFAPLVAIVVLIGPILCGLLATLLPAFGYFPALGGNDFTLSAFDALFAQPGIWQSTLVSLITGLITTLISLLIVLGFFAAWSGTAFFRKVEGILSPLLSIPHAAAAFGLAFMISPSGWLMRLVSPELTGMMRPPDWHILNDPMGLSMIAGLVIKEIPFLFLVTLAAMPQVRASQNRRIAASLGYGKMAGFVYSLWPQLYGQIRLAVFAVIAYASSVVDVALILGPTNPAPLAVRLVGWMNDPDLSLRFQASAGAMLQLATTAAALVIWIIGEKTLGALVRGLSATGRRYQADNLLRHVSAFWIALVAMVFTVGLFVLALWSIAGYWAFPDALPRGFTLQTWQNQLNGVEVPFLNTVLIGALSTLLAIILVLACLEREARTGRTGGNRALTLLYLPLIVPQAGFVFGLQMFFLVGGLNGGFLSLLLVHLVFVLPYVFLSLSDPWRAFDKRYAWTAAAMGVSRSRIFWKVRFPMLARAILVSCAIGFAVSIGQYLPTVLIGAGRWPTLTTEAVALASGGDRRVIGVYAFLQMLLPFLGFLLAALVPAIWFANRRDMQAER